MAVAVKNTLPFPAAVERTPNTSTSSGYVADRVLTAGFFLAAAAVAVQTAAHLSNALLFDYEVWNMDATGDGNALSWASSVATFAAALGAFLLGLLPAVPDRRLFALAAIFAFLSVDDVTAIHEKLIFADIYGLDIPDTVRRGLWPMLYAPLFLFAVLTLWRLSMRAQARIRQAIWLALALFAVSFVGEGIATLWWSDDPTSRFLVDDIEVAIEEGAELGAWILIATAFGTIFVGRLISLADTRRPRERVAETL